MASRPTLLILSQVYVPDPAALGQHMADAAAALAARGHRVVVFTADRGYEDPRRGFPSREVIGGVEVRRLPWSSFGKASMAARILGAASFLLQALLRAMFLPRLDGLLVSTSPPMCSVAALVIAGLRRVPIVYWAMDINPDQAVALGKFAPQSILVRAFNALNRLILRSARCVVALDHFMAERLEAKQPLGQRLAVLPPWPPSRLRPILDHRDNAFRRQQGLEGKIVVMYSGNLSIAHPLDTILQAALRLQHHTELLFLFVGGGLGRPRVEEFIARERPANVRLLPYQPLERLGESLAAADVHLVSMGEAMVGIVHPCKIYGAMAAGRPCLYLGPRHSHLGELVRRYQIGWQVEQGDVDRAVDALLAILATTPRQRAAMGRRAWRAVARDLSAERLQARFCELVEQTLPAGLCPPVGDGEGLHVAIGGRGPRQRLLARRLRRAGHRVRVGKPAAEGDVLLELVGPSTIVVTDWASGGSEKRGVLLADDVYGFRAIGGFGKRSRVERWIAELATARDAARSAWSPGVAPDAVLRPLFAVDWADAVAKDLPSMKHPAVRTLHGEAVLAADLATLLVELTGFRGAVDWTSRQPAAALGSPELKPEPALAGRNLTPLRAGLIRTIAWYERHAAPSAPRRSPRPAASEPAAEPADQSG